MRVRRRLIGGLTSLVGVLAVLSLAIGPSEVSLPDIGRGLWAAITGAGIAPEPGAAIVQTIRVPRTILGIAVGSSLGLAGAALQGIFRNPLVDPGLIGVSAGGAFGAALWFVVGAGLFAGIGATAGSILLTLFAFAGSAGALAVAYGAGFRRGDVSIATVLLAGIAVTALAFAGLGILTFISSDAELRSINFWTLGSLGGATWETIRPTVAAMAIACIVLLRRAEALNLYSLGEREARHLGCAVETLKTRTLGFAALATASAVAVSGVINFVGLVAPHLIRLIAGSDNRLVLPASALLGAALVLAADLVARVIVAPAELPIGIVTALMGAPFFLWLLIRQRRTLT